jgi:hypothetical protein
MAATPFAQLEVADATKRTGDCMDAPLPGLLTVTPAKAGAIISRTKMRTETNLRILKLRR